MALISVSPLDGKEIARYPEMTTGEWQTVLQQTQEAFHLNHKAGFAQRARWMHAASAELTKQKEALARLMALEMGKPLAQGRSEVDKCASVCAYYADYTAKALEPENVATERPCASCGKPKPASSVCARARAW